MLLKALFSVSLVAFSVNAAAVATPKPFKFEITDPSTGKWFISTESGSGTRDASKAATCTLDQTVMKCNGKGFPDFSGDMVVLTTDEEQGGSAGWSVGADGKIDWDAVPEMKFGVMGDNNEVWAAVCPHDHFDGHRGDAKAVYA